MASENALFVTRARESRLKAMINNQKELTQKTEETLAEERKQTEQEIFEDILGLNGKEEVKKTAFGSQVAEKIIFSINVMGASKWQHGQNAQLFISESGAIFISSTDETGQLVINRTFQIMSLRALTLL